MKRGRGALKAHLATVITDNFSQYVFNAIPFFNPMAPRARVVIVCPAMADAIDSSSYRVARRRVGIWHCWRLRDRDFVVGSGIVVCDFPLAKKTRKHGA